MRGGCEAYDHKARVGIAEGRDGAPPIFPIAIGAPLCARNAFAIWNEARTFPAVHNFLLQHD